MQSMEAMEAIIDWHILRLQDQTTSFGMKLEWADLESDIFFETCENWFDEKYDENRAARLAGNMTHDTADYVFRHTTWRDANQFYQVVHKLDVDQTSEIGSRISEKALQLKKLICLAEEFLRLMVNAVPRGMMCIDSDWIWK